MLYSMFLVIWVLTLVLLWIGQVVEVISTAIGDMMQAEFTSLRDCHGSAILPADGVTIADWEQQTFLASGTLISSSCKAALMLAQHSGTLQQRACEFGKQIALACQVCIWTKWSCNLVISRGELFLKCDYFRYHIFVELLCCTKL